jgi:hypothetical protein
MNWHLAATFWTFIQAHQTTAVVVAAWVVVYGVSTMPSPDANSGKFYKWLFGFTHALVGLLPRLFPNLRLPSDPSRDSPAFFNTKLNGGNQP